METIFIGIPAFNEEDLHQTIKTCLKFARNPREVHFGIALQYTEGNYPDLSMYPGISAVQIDEKTGIGTCPTRKIATSLYNNETYYLQIDAHTIFKPDWDFLLKVHYKNLKRITDKPIITTYVPHWVKDFKTGEILNMQMQPDLNKKFPQWRLKPKGEDMIDMSYGAESMPSPYLEDADYSKNPYDEHFLISGHFLFTDARYLQEIPFDDQLVYHEENTAALRAWTRGYRMFSIKDDVLWTREMFHGRDVPNSWRQTAGIKNEKGIAFMDSVVKSCYRCKNILTGKELGTWGSPSQELFEEYQNALGLNYQEFYDKMYAEVEKNPGKYPAGESLYFYEKGLKNG